MIVKYYEIRKIILEEKKFVLLYGKNEGLKNESISSLIKDKSKVSNYDEKQILDNQDNFLENAMADLNPLGLTQMRNLEKKKGMEEFGGPTFTDEDAEMLKELQTSVP